MASVEFTNIHKSYGAVDVVRDLSLRIEDGEFVTLVGPSGCGKSTLLRMLAGLESITDGDVSIGEKVVTDLPPKSRDIAMVFQNYALYPHMTVAENMAFSLKLKGVSKGDMKQSINDAAEILGLSALLERYPRELSGGQRQRVAMGRAIVRKPQVFLFDEPLSNLDAKLRVTMRSEIKTLHQKLKTTVIYVTHDQIEAMTMADRIVVMRNGVIEQVGAPLDVYDHPANTFVAGFIGSPSMNFIEGEVKSNCFIGKSGLRVHLGSRRTPDSKVTLGIRPEQLNVTSPDVPGAIPFNVIVSEPTGSDTQLVVTDGDTTLTLVSKERLTIAAGDIVHVTFPEMSCHLFDTISEARINMTGVIGQ